MIHIVFQEADVAVLEKAIALDPKLAGRVVQIKDDYAVGPIENIYQPEGFQLRKAFWQEALQFSPYTAQQDMVDDKWTVFNLVKYLKGDRTATFGKTPDKETPQQSAGKIVNEGNQTAAPGETTEESVENADESIIAEASVVPVDAAAGETTIAEAVAEQPTVEEAPAAVVIEDDGPAELWIWMGQNQHDVCGYYWLMSQLAEYQGKIQVLYMNNLPFINEKGGIFYPANLYEIQPKEFLKAKRLARQITLSEFEVDPDEWRKLCRENAMVRILEGGKKIVSKDAAFFDQDILQAAGKEGGKLNKIVSNTLSKMKAKTGDVFLVWRIRQLAEAGKLDITGDWAKGWKEIVVRPAGMAAEAAAAAGTEETATDQTA
ncbi:DUF3658 domain-containing protein [Deminuibacter soli]|uniref:DUF1835 domain-containing protein n=1 Tax=Deminuibacter soli TaxID=2291815 RepID=A0A3E1NJ47_9BACT|nr:DUF3658 domain-containing protein [Deminuibacter soli]RFM27960.1 DUF1835 domain-containing protein [Deminuibacter soli]